MGDPKTMTIEVILSDDANEAAVQNELSTLLHDNPDSGILGWQLANLEQAQARIDCRRRLGVIMQGGNVQDIVSDNPDDFADTDVLLIDYDTDGCDDIDLIDVPQGEKEPVSAYVQEYSVTKEGIGLSGVHNAFLEKEDARSGPR